MWRSARRHPKRRRSVGDLDRWQRAVEKHGWVVVYVPDTPHGPLHYTVGLTQHGLAEVVAYGLTEAAGGHLLNDLAGRLLSGQAYTNGTDILDLTEGGYRVQLHPAAPLIDPLGVAEAMYGDRLTVRQLVLPDTANRLPWENGYTDSPPQPLLFEPPATR